MSLDYAREKLMGAVFNLATGQSSIKTRVFSAWMEMHTLRNPSVDLPKSIREGVDRIQGKLTVEPSVGSEGMIRATLNEMTDNEAAVIAEDMVSLFIEVMRIAP